jgi:hypothetical protein
MAYFGRETHSIYRKQMARKTGIPPKTTTKEYFQTEDEKIYFFESLEKEISVEDMQKIVDANEKLVKELKSE